MSSACAGNPIKEQDRTLTGVAGTHAAKVSFHAAPLFGMCHYHMAAGTQSPGPGTRTRELLWALWGDIA